MFSDNSYKILEEVKNEVLELPNIITSSIEKYTISDSDFFIIDNEEESFILNISLQKIINSKPVDTDFSFVLKINGGKIDDVILDIEFKRPVIMSFEGEQLILILSETFSDNWMNDMLDVYNKIFV